MSVSVFTASHMCNVCTKYFKSVCACAFEARHNHTSLHT